MRIYDLSQTISEELAVYPGDAPFKRSVISSTPNDVYNLSLLSIGSHCGTHIDAPLHFLDGGTAIADIPLEKLVGRAAVVDLPYSDGILKMQDVTDKLANLSNTEILILRTGWERFAGSNDYFIDFPAFDSVPAEALAEHGITAIAADLPSVSLMGNQRAAHEALLSQGIIIIEGIVGLDALPKDCETLYLSAAPLKIAGSDGSPARVYAFTV